jgi:predicted DCC family thiol-disulfide oxidoreductase YuxK
MERHVVLYDADCGLCRWSLDKILQWDRGRQVRAVAIQSEEGDRLLADISEDERLASWHFVTPDGRRFSGGSAAGPLARLLPFGLPVAVLAETFPRTTDHLYRWVARNRDWLGRRVGSHACAVDPGRRLPPSSPI